MPEDHRLSAETIEVWSLHESLAESVVHQGPRIVHHHEDHTFTRILHDIVALAHAWVASARLPDDRAVVLHAASRRVAVLKARGRPHVRGGAKRVVAEERRRASRHAGCRDVDVLQRDAAARRVPRAKDAPSKRRRIRMHVDVRMVGQRGKEPVDGDVRDGGRGRGRGCVGEVELFTNMSD